MQFGMDFGGVEMELVRLNNVTKRFGGLVAADDVSACFGSTQAVGLIGPNGAGKTTLFSLIMGEHRPTSGSIEFFGSDISGLPTHARVRLGVARTYQVPRPFFGLTVTENIRVGLMRGGVRDYIFGRIDSASERSLAYSVGFAESDLDRYPSELSMGDLRKLEMARTLATGAKVILLDEVFAGLTASEIRQISELITAKRKEGVSFVIVSHDLRSLEPLVDRVVAMSRGRVISEGTFLDVMSDDSVRRSYLGD